VTRRGDDAVERDALIAALGRLLDGQAKNSSGKLSVKALAEEAGLARTALTHKHTDIRDLVAHISRQIAPVSAAQQAEEASVIAKLRQDLATEWELNGILSTQLAAAILRIEQLPDRRLRPLHRTDGAGD